MINLSRAAANEIRRLKDSRAQPNSYFRLGVKPGGCAGLYYTLELSDTPQEGDRLYESEGISILVDESSDSYCQELKLDYGADLMGGGFRFHNPHVSSPCGCGLSFAGRSG